GVARTGEMATVASKVVRMEKTNFLFPRSQPCFGCMVKRMSREGLMMPPQTVKSPRAESPQSDAPLAIERDEHFGRSPDLRVIAWPDLPAVHGTTVVNSGLAHRLQLRGQSWNKC